MHYFIKRYNVLYIRLKLIKDMLIYMDKRHTEEEKYIVNKFNEYKEFIKDKHVSFVIRKTERIVYGVYMLSKFVPEQDPLLRDIKKTAHDLLEVTSKFVSSTGIHQSDIDKTHTLLQYMSSLLTLAFISSYISASNIEIIKNEINYLHKHIEELSTQFASETGQLEFKSDLFVVNQSKQYKHTDEKKSFIKEKEALVRTQITPKMSFKKQSLQPVQSRVAPVLSESKDDREKRVLDVIRDKGVVSIKDISTVIFDVSEKTIQRTLQLLIDKGQIKKEGERRWAKYQLV